MVVKGAGIGIDSVNQVDFEYSRNIICAQSMDKNSPWRLTAREKVLHIGLAINALDFCRMTKLNKTIPIKWRVDDK